MCRIGSWVKHSHSLRVHPMHPEPSLLVGSALVAGSKRQIPDIQQTYEASISWHEIFRETWGYPDAFPLFDQIQILWVELGWRWRFWLIRIPTLARTVRATPFSGELPQDSESNASLISYIYSKSWKTTCSPYFLSQLALYYITEGPILCGLGVWFVGEPFLAHSKRIIRM